MSPKVHEGMLIVFSIVAISIMLLMFMKEIAGEGDTSCIVVYFCGWFIGGLALELMFIYLVPVRCTKTGCKGRMEPGWDEDGKLQWRLVYRCDTCDNVHLSNYTLGIGHWDEG